LIRSGRFLGLFAGLLTFACASVPHPPAAESAPPHVSFVIDSLILREQRPIHVFTPPQAAGASRLPVLYMLDGGLHEDFPHVANTIAGLIEKGEIPPVHVVGIENTERRRDVTSETGVASDREIAPHVGGAAAFLSFIRNELIPEVERRLDASDERALVGESLAGQFVLETFFAEPRLFTLHIAISPSVWWNDRALPRAIDELLRARGAVGGSLFLSAANEVGLAEDVSAIAAAIARHAPPHLRWVHVPRPDLEHGTIFRAVEADAYRFAFAREP
jgi:predicted alpha/beta superfamily hydrolase